MTQFNSPHPGKTLKLLILDERQITITEFAKKIQISRPVMTNICNGKASITYDVALRLGVVLGTGPDLWIKMQNNYDYHQARKKFDKRKLDLKALDEMIINVV